MRTLRRLALSEARPPYGRTQREKSEAAEAETIEFLKSYRFCSLCSGPSKDGRHGVSEKLYPSKCIFAINIPSYNLLISLLVRMLISAIEIHSCGKHENIFSFFLSGVGHAVGTIPEASPGGFDSRRAYRIYIFSGDRSFPRIDGREVMGSQHGRSNSARYWRCLRNWRLPGTCCSESLTARGVSQGGWRRKQAA